MLTSDEQDAGIDFEQSLPENTIKSLLTTNQNRVYEKVFYHYH